ncbi:hypothetical protein HDU76_012359 [Blyttiomyces sp. JEL0837]|nr:hypothetical protein HDU76_012359 [Blyttiomyces sp. JEL0837]
MSTSTAIIPKTASSTANRLPQRPVSTNDRIGKKIEVDVNLYKLDTSKLKKIYRYDVKITHAGGNLEKKISPAVARRVHEAWSKASQPNIVTVYDTKSIMYSSEMLYAERQSTVFDVRVYDDDVGPGLQGQPQQPPAPRSSRTFKLSIGLTGELHPSHIDQFLSGRRLEEPTKIISAMELAFRHYAIIQGNVTFGNMRTYFNPTNEDFINRFDQRKRRVVPQSELGCHCRLFTWKISTPIDETELKQFSNQVRDLKFTLTHLPKFRAKKIQAVSNPPPRQKFFQFVDANARTRQISVQQYYNDTYGIRLTFPHLPCVEVKQGGDRIAYFPMELCQVVPGQRFRGKLDSKQTSAMITFLGTPPHVRRQEIQNIRQHNISNSDSHLKEFGISVSEKMAVVSARVLPPPTLYFNPTSTKPILAVNSSKDNWDFMGRQVMVSSNEVRSWGNEMGIQFVEDPPITRAKDKTVADDLKRMVAFIVSKSKVAKVDILVCILKDRELELYPEIKRVAETINAKLGGVNAVLSREQLPFIHDAPTLVIRIDVSHPGVGENAPSITAVVGSMDPHCGRFSSVIGEQAFDRSENIADLQGMLEEILIFVS